MTARLKRMSAIAGLGLLFAGTIASAQAENLVTNGSFEETTNGSGQLGYNTDATGWTTSGYNFLFSPGSADTTGVTGASGNLQLWGPGNNSANGMPTTSPDGGNFVGADGAYNVGAITQTITGLTVGEQYTVGFWWAAAQQSGFTGPTTEQWAVSLGGETFDTPVADNANHGFIPWTYQTFTYTATSTSEILSFLANGTPSGEPPFSLLDGVSLEVSVPEPASMALLGIGLLGLGCIVWRRRSDRKTTGG